MKQVARAVKLIDAAYERSLGDEVASEEFANLVVVYWPTIRAALRRQMDKE